jgi:hypothetical protein
VDNEVGEEKVQRYVMRAWAGFARKPEKALEELGWLRYNATGTSSISI